MADYKDFRVESKKSWGVTKNGELTFEEVQTGCMLRIADASEKMASNFTQLQNDLDWYKKRCQTKSDEIRELEKRISSMKGQITKLKNKLSNQNTNDKLLF